MVKRPSRSVTAPRFVPTTLTFAPISASPDLSSFTVPSITPARAETAASASTKEISANSLAVPFIWLCPSSQVLIAPPSAQLLVVRGAPRRLSPVVCVVANSRERV